MLARHGRLGLLLLSAGLAAIAGAWWLQRSFGPGGAALPAGAVIVAGGDAGGLPRADATAEGFERLPLQQAEAWAVARHARALLVSRHGHLVSEHYGHAERDSLFDGGELGDTVLQLAAAIAQARHGMVVTPEMQADPGRLAAAIAAASGRTYPQFLSRSIWQPLNAAPAQWSRSGMRARGSDWLRVAELLLHDGRFEGTQVVPAGVVQRFAHSRSAIGAEPFADDSMYRLRGPGATRLWLSPRFDLAILCVADASESPALGADETRLPNMLVRALRDRPRSGGTSLNDLVPGH
ncbi:MAG: hypothetical protein KGL25_13335 [Gammaproteobacteria bacterium]|nr:hypothetical protein [Gammaproteobacteria bacterium]MDE2252377.1 hypothetical protein [Gammaproteobacteria bacterium]